MVPLQALSRLLRRAKDDDLAVVVSCHKALAKQPDTQRTQYPVIKEYTLNHRKKAPIILGTFLN